MKQFLIATKVITGRSRKARRYFARNMIVSLLVELVGILDVIAEEVKYFVKVKL
jgi:hypothetical protein